MVRKARAPRVEPRSGRQIGRLRHLHEGGATAWVTPAPRRRAERRRVPASSGLGGPGTRRSALLLLGQLLPESARRRRARSPSRSVGTHELEGLKRGLREHRGAVLCDPLEVSPVASFLARWPEYRRGSGRAGAPASPGRRPIGRWRVPRGDRSGPPSSRLIEPLAASAACRETASGPGRSSREPVLAASRRHATPPEPAGRLAPASRGSAEEAAEERLDGQELPEHRVDPATAAPVAACSNPRPVRPRTRPGRSRPRHLQKHRPLILLDLGLTLRGRRLRVDPALTAR